MVTHSKNFRKLDIEVQQQPLVDQRPWLIIGVLVALIVLILFICAYLGRAKTTTTLQGKKPHFHSIPTGFIMPA